MNTLVYAFMAMVCWWLIKKPEQEQKNVKWLVISILTLIGYVIAYIWKHPLPYGPL